jgi:hypothetical protein
MLVYIFVSNFFALKKIGINIFLLNSRLLCRGLATQSTSDKPVRDLTTPEITVSATVAKVCQIQHHSRNRIDLAVDNQPNITRQTLPFLGQHSKSHDVKHPIPVNAQL